MTALKKRAEDFKLNQIRQEIQKHSSTGQLYEFSRAFLPTLEVSNENIRYYASLAEYYPVHRLQHMPKNQAQLYLLRILVNVNTNSGDREQLFCPRIGLGLFLA